MAQMHYLLGYRTDKFVVLASDKNAFLFGAINASSDASKEYQLGDKLVMTVVGEDGDPDNFGDWAKRNLFLYKLRHNYELSPRSAHHWLRKNIAENLRSQDFWRIDLLIGGYDQHEKKAYLGSVDYMGTAIENQNFLFRGFSGHFGLSVMDAFYNKDATVEQAVDILRKCIGEGKRRFIASLQKFSVLVIDEDGVRHLDDIEG